MLRRTPALALGPQHRCNNVLGALSQFPSHYKSDMAHSSLAGLDGGRQFLIYSWPRLFRGNFSLHSKEFLPLLHSNTQITIDTKVQGNSPFSADVNWSVTKARKLNHTETQWAASCLGRCFGFAKVINYFKPLISHGTLAVGLRAHVCVLGVLSGNYWYTYYAAFFRML